MTQNVSKCVTFLEYWIWVARLWGIITGIGLWGIGVETCYDGNHLGGYLLFVAIIVTFLETTFLLNIFITVCVSDTHIDEDDDHVRKSCSCARCWEPVLRFEYWKKGILYTCLGALCFVQPHVVWKALINGIMLLILAIIHFIRTFELRYLNEALILLEKPSYDRFADVEDIDLDINGEMHIDIPSLPATETETLAEQAEILDV